MQRSTWSQDVAFMEVLLYMEYIRASRGRTISRSMRVLTNLRLPS